MRITVHFTTSEFERSQTAARLGIDTTIDPNSEIFQNVRALCLHVLEPLREKLDRPLIISSGYRPPALNSEIGGSEHSQHMVGQAADVNAVGMNDYDLACYVRDSGLPFDQLIYEFGRWVHMSFGPRQRGDVLTAYRKQTGGVAYIPGVHMISSIEGAER